VNQIESVEVFQFEFGRIRDFSDPDFSNPMKGRG
jgi:hypothetical protein